MDENKGVNPGAREKKSEGDCVFGQHFEKWERSWKRYWCRIAHRGLWEFCELTHEAVREWPLLVEVDAGRVTSRTDHRCSALWCPMCRAWRY
jgi:hypothetical protein